ncbi:MAG: 30S ribosomal protein S4 [Chloroflexi bacterium]|nr:MAG: 30S ribosomal protein S4 [Chloroflexota bacterium]
MARYTGPVCRLCRAEGEKLFLKGSRCLTPKCAFEKRPFVPGAHGNQSTFKRKRDSNFLLQLRAKQRVRRTYGLLERQFQRYYEAAAAMRGVTGVNMLQLLETRLDNVVYRLGYAQSRAQARILVSHGHFTVNDRRTNVPSVQLGAGDVVRVRQSSRANGYFKEVSDLAEVRSTPGWLSRNISDLDGKVLQLPLRNEIDTPVNEQLVVEFYSR